MTLNAVSRSRLYAVLPHHLHEEKRQNRMLVISTDNTEWAGARPSLEASLRKKDSLWI